jgi:site-specific recombinase XerD
MNEHRSTGSSTKQGPRTDSLGATGSAAASRCLGHGQLAFVRSWAEGLDLVAAWDRYLFVDGAGDGRRARGELKRLLDELGGIARAHGRPELAALLRRDPEAIADRGPKAPSLEAFAAEQPADFYTEAELIELYQAQYGQADARSAARRRQRLRERLVEAVKWLEHVGPRQPQPSDLISAWLDERLAARLAVVGILKLEELVSWIGDKGFRWHRGIPKVGPERASRVVRWLREHEDQLGALPYPALVPAKSIDTKALTPLPRCGIVPLERFSLPSELDGSQGRNRAPVERCKIDAVNDYAAIQSWLDRLVEGNQHTWRAYRKEAERFLLWSVIERRKALSSLDGSDCVAYRDFLADPGPAWRGKRNKQRWSEAWRPFEAALSVRSQEVAITIVSSLCEWLVRRHYLDSNPWDDVPARAEAEKMPQLRALSQKQWQVVQDWLDGQIESARDGLPSPALLRLRFMMNFAYMTGLRLAEMAAATVKWLKYEQLEDDEWAWSMMVLGKGKTWREVPLPDLAVEALKAYFRQRGLVDDLLANDKTTPLIAKLKGNKPLGKARIYDILSGAFKGCAEAIKETDPRASERIQEASTHWLRHTYGSHAAARGVPQDVLQANLGHKSLATTSIYVQAEKGRKHRAVQAAFGSATKDG